MAITSLEFDRFVWRGGFMAEMFRALLMGLGCLMTLWLGSCTLFGVGTVVAVNTAAEIAKKERAKHSTEDNTPSKWDRNSSSAYTPSYGSGYNGSGYNSSYYENTGSTHTPNRIDGKPMTNPNSYNDY